MVFPVRPGSCHSNIPWNAGTGNSQGVMSCWVIFVRVTERCWKVRRKGWAQEKQEQRNPKIPHQMAQPGGEKSQTPFSISLRILLLPKSEGIFFLCTKVGAHPVFFGCFGAFVNPGQRKTSKISLKSRKNKVRKRSCGLPSLEVPEVRLGLAWDSGKCPCPGMGSMGWDSLQSQTIPPHDSMKKKVFSTSTPSCATPNPCFPCG